MNFKCKITKNSILNHNNYIFLFLFSPPNLVIGITSGCGVDFC